MDGSTPGGAPAPKLPGNGTSPAATPSVPGAQGGPGEPSAAVSNAVGNAASSIASKALGDSGPQPTGENGELQAGDKVGNGKVMGEDGQVKKSRGRQFVDNAETAGKVAAAVATGGGSAAAGEAGGVAAGQAAGQAAGKAAAEQAGKAAAENAAKSAGETAAKNAAGNTAKAAQNMSKQAGKSFDSNKMQEAYNKAKDSQAGQQAKEGVLDQAKNKIADKVDEAADKNEAVGMAIDEFNDIMNPITNAVGGLEKALTGDFKGAGEELKESKEGLKKLSKKMIRRMVIGGAICLLFNIIIFAVVFGPTMGLYIEITENIHDLFESIEDVVIIPDPVDPDPGDPNPGDPPKPIPDEPWPDNIDDIVAKIEGMISPDVLARLDYHLLYSDEAVILNYRRKRAQELSTLGIFQNLSQTRKNILFSAATMSAINAKYSQANSPSGPGINGYPRNGTDCGRFAQWSVWSATGMDPGNFNWRDGFNHFNMNMLESIPLNQIQPGDVIKANGHVLIYAGVNSTNRICFEALNSRLGVMRTGWRGKTSWGDGFVPIYAFRVTV